MAALIEMYNCSKKHYPDLRWEGNRGNIENFN